ncbi:hypothetical protein MKW92_053871 [Papaver armeniacum]|nr:hypothetical protein MKW92_053871 [Papaver armeniacum]
MAAARELVSDDHQAMISSGLAKVESKLEANTSITTAISYKNDEKKHKASPNPSSSSSTNPFQHPEEDTTINSTTAATEILAANTERTPSSDNQEITEVITYDHNDQIEKSAEDGGQVMSTDVLDGYKELYEAAMKGDWKVARKFLQKYPEAITKVITSDSRTVLHVAICNGNLKFTKRF